MVQNNAARPKLVQYIGVSMYPLSVGGKKHENTNKKEKTTKKNNLFKIPHPCHRRTFLWCCLRKRVGEGFQHAFKKQKSILRNRRVRQHPAIFKKAFCGSNFALHVWWELSKTIWREHFQKTIWRELLKIHLAGTISWQEHFGGKFDFFYSKTLQNSSF